MTDIMWVVDHSQHSSIAGILFKQWTYFNIVHLLDTVSLLVHFF